MKQEHKMTDFPVTNLKKDIPFCSARIKLKIKPQEKLTVGKQKQPEICLKLQNLAPAIPHKKMSNVNREWMNLKGGVYQYVAN